MSLNNPSQPAESKATPIIPDDDLPPLKFERSDLLWALTLALMALIPGIPFLLHHQTIIGLFPAGNSENLNEWMIYRQFINRSFAAGLLPAWTPQLLAGMPFIGWPHTSVFAPLGLIYANLPFSTAAVAGLFVHAAIFIVSMYVLLRLVPVRPLAAWCAAAMSYNFFIISESEHFLPRLFTYSWTPLFLACCLGLWRTRRLRFFIGAAVLICLQELGGNVEIIVRQSLCLASLALALIVFRPAELWRRRRPVLLILAAVAAGSFPALVQSLPALEYFHLGVRSSHEWFSYPLYASTAGMKPGLLHPVLTPVILAVLAVFIMELRRGLAPRVAALALALNAALVFNPFGVLKLFYRLPVLGNMMWHQLSLLFVYILATALAAMTIDHVMARPDRRKYVLVLALAALASGLMDLMVARLGIPATLPFPAGNITAAAGRLAPAGIALAIAGLAMYGFKPGRPGLERAFLVGVVLAAYYSPSFSIPHREDDSFPRFSPAYINFFSRQASVSRSMTILSTEDWDHPAIPFQVGIVPGTETIDAFISSPIRWYAEFYLLLLPQARPKEAGRQANTVFWNLKNNYQFSEDNLRLFNLLNVASVTTLGVNLKFASHYYLSRGLGPETCRGRPCSLRESGPPAAASGRAVILDPPSQWDQTLYLPAGAELRMGIEPPRPAGTTVMFQALAAGPEHTGPRIIFARALDAAPGAAPLPVRAGLASLQDRTVSLSFRAAPIGDLPAPGAGIALLNPCIYNPNAYLKREPVEGADIFTNPGALPRAFVTHRARVIAGKEERLAYIGGPRFDPSAEVVLEHEVPAFHASGREMREPVKILLYRPGRIVLHADLAEEGFLVISDTYCPGWIASVGGAEERILRADHAFQAVRLGRGPSRVTLTYWPLSLRIGLWAALAGAISLAILMAAKLFAPGRGRVRGPGPGGEGFFDHN
ncbi:MAG TPA: hypothetical protein VM658_07150 [bacterium]|nr:hypothetical protein [bacterium]